MAAEGVGSPEEQALEAMREAVRKIDAEREYIQHQPGPNEAFDKLLANPVDTDALRDAIRNLEDAYPPLEEPPCASGPGCGCPYHSMHEIELRQHRRALADSDGWSLAPGECTACGMDDRPVKGPPGAELCDYCEQLRISPPPLPFMPGQAPVPHLYGCWPGSLWEGMKYGLRALDPAWGAWAVGFILLLDGKMLMAVGCFAVVLLLMGVQRRRP